MRHIALSLLLLLAAVAALGQGGTALPDEVYSTPGPHVVVNGVLLKAPVKEVGGSLFLPMRAVFEALQAEVRWFPAAQQIVATRGATTVQLWIKKAVAIVNDKEIPLAAPPTLIDRVTYVPLRFPAEAFGGEVKWFGAVRTAAITITPLGSTAQAGPPPDPKPGPDPKPTPDAASLDGVLVTKVTTGVAALLVQHAKGETTLVQMAHNAVVTRANADQPAQASTFAALEPGDLVWITRDASGKATAVAARFAQVKGVATAIANNRLLLHDGSLYQLQPDIRVVNTTGQAVPLAQIGNGAAVTLDLTPDTTNVWRITVPVQAAQPPPPVEDAPGILAVAAVGYTKPARSGETLTIQVTGEPNAERVTASIGDVLRDVALDETAPGTYTRKVKIPANMNATAAPIVAKMRLNGKDTASVKSAVPVTVDTRPPSFDALIPGDGSELPDRSLTVEAAYADPGGSGVDAKAVKLLVRGKDVTRQATITDSRLSYKGVRLPEGSVTIRLEIADLAGNAASADWTVTVAATQSDQEQYVKHNAAAQVMAGSKLSLTARFAATPVKLEWYLGNKRISTAMVKDDASGEYRASYYVDPATALGESSVSVRVFTAADQSQVIYATTPVKVVAQPKTFKITAPADGEKAPSPLVVTGQATPGVQVRVTVAYAGRVAFVPLKGELYKEVLTADEKGVWATEPVETTSMLVKPDTYTVTAELLDSEGKVTNTATISLARK